MKEIGEIGLKMMLSIMRVQIDTAKAICSTHALAQKAKEHLEEAEKTYNFSAQAMRPISGNMLRRTMVEHGAQETRRRFITQRLEQINSKRGLKE